LFPVSFCVSTKFYYQNPCHIIVYITYYQEYCISYVTEALIFYADKVMVMSSSKNLRVFNVAILLKSRKFDSHKIYLFCINSRIRWNL